MVVVEFLSDIISHGDKLVFLFGFQLRNEFESCLFIICHVFIPSIGKFLVLESLGVFNIGELSRLRDSHIMCLSLLFVSAPSIKDFLKLVCHHVISHALVTFSHFVHNPKQIVEKIKN